MKNIVSPRKKIRPIGLLLVMLGGFLAPQAFSEGHDFYLYFDDAHFPDAASDGSPNKLDMKYYRAKEVDISTKNKKFGTGSLHITGETVGGIRQGLDEDPHTRLAEAIEKMSIVTWVYLPEGGEGALTLLARLAPGAQNRDGDWKLTLLRDKGVRFSTGAGALNNQKSWLPLQNNRWVHLAFIYDNGAVSFYVDGQNVTSMTGSLIGKSGPIPATSLEGQKARIECLVPANSYVDDFGFFANAALTEPQIGEIVKNGLQSFVENRAETRTLLPKK